MHTKTIASLLFGFLGLFLVSNSLVVVYETETGVLLRFGALKKVGLEPGLLWKLPFVDKVKKFDQRVLTYDASPESYFTIENKRLIVDSYVKWRIADAESYYKSTDQGNEFTAQQRLSSRVSNGLRNKFGERTMHEVVSGQRDELIADITSEVDEAVRKDLGIEVLDIRVKRIDLPDEVSDPVYRRMKTDREKEARQYRSTGKEAAEKIRADADRQQRIIEANAFSDAEQIRGQGDAEAAGIYASAYNQDQEFYAFFRSLNAYKEAFRNKGDLMVIDPESDFFRYLNNATGEK